MRIIVSLTLAVMICFTQSLCCFASETVKPSPLSVEEKIAVQQDEIVALQDNEVKEIAAEGAGTTLAVAAVVTFITFVIAFGPIMS